MLQAATDIVEGLPHAFDVGRFNDDYFVYIAAFGLFTDVSYETNQDMKNILGHAAYILEGTQRLFNIKSYSLQIESDEGKLSGDFIFGMVSNATSVGGFKTSDRARMSCWTMASLKSCLSENPRIFWN